MNEQKKISMHVIFTHKTIHNKASEAKHLVKFIFETENTETKISRFYRKILYIL